MKNPFLYLSMILLARSCSCLYASDLQSVQATLSATEQELANIDRDIVNKVSHADATVETLHSVLPKDAVSLVIDYLRTTVKSLYRRVPYTHLEPGSHACGNILDFRITGITKSVEAQDITNIATSFIRQDHCGSYSVHHGDIRYNHIIDTFSPFFRFFRSAGLSATQAREQFANLDQPKYVSTAMLSDGRTVTALPPRLLCIDNNDAYLVEAHSRWLSHAAYTQWLSRMNNKCQVKTLAWNGRQS